MDLNDSLALRFLGTLLVRLGCTIAVAMGSPVLADEGSQMPRGVPPAYLEECAACHVAYPPGMLPAASWSQIMSTLDRHFGSDASLEPGTAQPIAGWLASQAGRYKRVSGRPPEDRITRSSWFERKHRTVAAAVWSLPSVKGPSQCAACHRNAERSIFDEDDLIRPKGALSFRQRIDSR